MACFTIFLLLIAAIGVVAAALTTAGTASRRRWNQPFAQIARRRFGEQTRGGWFGPPLVRFKYGWTFARLTAYPAPGGDQAQVLELVVQVPELRFDLTVVPRGSHLRLPLHVRGMQALPFDWADFRERYQVYVGDAEEARPALSSGVRLAIDTLAIQPEKGEVAINLRSGWLFVQKVWASHRADDADLFVEDALALYEQLLLSRTAGIEFVEEDQVQLLEDAKCAICGESLAQQVVICRRCRTPHHRDCWEYAGSCSTYGCRETIYLTPPPARDPRRDSGLPPPKPR